MKKCNDFIDKLFNSRFYHIICFLFFSFYLFSGIYGIELSSDLYLFLAMPSAFYLEYLVLTFFVKIIKRS